LKNVLVICWDFPPKRSIGGRRWAKHVKELLKLGMTVSVIAGRTNQVAGGESWISAKELRAVKTYFLGAHFASEWLNDYNSPIKIFKIRLAKLFLNCFFNGTIYDKAIGIERKFVDLAEYVIEQDKIDCIFVTGAPFNLLYYTAKLKPKFPGVKVIADFRDPWINAKNYGMPALNRRRMNYEKRKQNLVLEHADVVSAPYESLLDEIRQSYSGSVPIRARFIHLPHAFDRDDVVMQKQRNESAPLRVIYPGTLYLSTEVYLKFINDSIKYLKKKMDGRNS
jgi:hypothetical protein